MGSFTRGGPFCDQQQFIEEHVKNSTSSTGRRGYDDDAGYIETDERLSSESRV